MEASIDITTFANKEQFEQFINTGKEKIKFWIEKLGRLAIEEEVQINQKHDWRIHINAVEGRNSAKLQYLNTKSLQQLQSEYDQEKERVTVETMEAEEMVRDKKDTIRRLRKRLEGREREIREKASNINELETKALVLESEELQTDVRKQRYQVFTADETQKCFNWSINSNSLSNLDYIGYLNELNGNRKEGDKITLTQLKNKFKNVRRKPPQEITTKKDSEPSVGKK